MQGTNEKQPDIASKEVHSRDLSDGFDSKGDENILTSGRDPELDDSEATHPVKLMMRGHQPSFGNNKTNGSVGEKLDWGIADQSTDKIQEGGRGDESDKHTNVAEEEDFQVLLREFDGVVQHEELVKFYEDANRNIVEARVAIVKKYPPAIVEGPKFPQWTTGKESGAMNFVDSEEKKKEEGSSLHLDQRRPEKIVISNSPKPVAMGTSEEEYKRR